MVLSGDLIAEAVSPPRTLGFGARKRVAIRAGPSRSTCGACDSAGTAPATRAAHPAWAPALSPYFIVGITKSAPARMPVGSGS